MDYLDSRKELRHRIVLLVGYVLIAVAIAIATVILLYQAYGFGINKNGAVIQNTLTFFSSHPSPAKIYLNGKLEPVTTNRRLVLPEGIYNVRLVRDGYREWRRTIELDGGDVQHFDYPFLIPKKIDTKTIHIYNAQPGLVTQSPDQRWLLIQQPGAGVIFDLYDLKNPAQTPKVLTLPEGVATKGIKETWRLSEWSTDNRHLLLRHEYDGKPEFVLFDRKDPIQSVNLNRKLAVNPAKLTFKDKKYDQYYMYDAGAQELKSISLNDPSTMTSVLQHVLAYQPYGKDTILYVTSNGAPSGKVVLRLREGSKTYFIRRLPAGDNYLVDLTEYSGVMYAAAGSSNSNKVYIFKDPLGQLADHPGRAVAPIQVLHVPGASYLSFSSSAQFIMAENGNHYGVYDIENDKGFNYVSPKSLDVSQAHAKWMDGNRLSVVSGNKLVIFDYDNSNQQVIAPASANYAPAFAPDYKNAYVLDQSGQNGHPSQLRLVQISLLIPSDR